MSKPNEIAAQLKILWEAEIRLFEQIQCLDFLPNPEEPDSAGRRENLPDLLAEVHRLSHASQRLQNTWNQFELGFETDLVRIRTKKNDSLKKTMDYVRHAQQCVNAGKREVLEQLAAVNRAQAGNDRYRKRKR